MELKRIIISEVHEQQIIVLREVDGERSFPIVIGIFAYALVVQPMKHFSTIAGGVALGIGSLHALLSINQQLRVITTFMGTGIMSQSGSPLPMDRVYFANPGDRITFGDRTLTAYKPPVYDNSVTTAFRDETSGLLFTADSFGALLGDIPDAASDLDPDALHHGQTTWVSIDSPWIHRLDRAAFERELSDLRAFDPSLVLSGHLPPAPGTMLTRMLETLVAAVDAPPFAGPGQAFLDAQADAMRLAQVDRFITRAISGLRIP